MIPSARTRLRARSKKRQREMIQRRRMLKELFGDEPMCVVPDCTRRADDAHEPLTRARGGSITDKDNVVPVCRTHHDALTFSPESELGWAYELGLLKHSWEKPA